MAECRCYIGDGPPFKIVRCSACSAADQQHADNGLLLRALAAGRVKLLELTVDPAGLPILTPELRAKLKEVTK